MALFYGLKLFSENIPDVHPSLVAQRFKESQHGIPNVVKVESPGVTPYLGHDIKDEVIDIT